MLRKSLVLMILVALTGCASVSNHYTAPTTELPAGFEIESAGLRAGDWSESDWWSRFRDPVLEALVAEGLSNNLDLREAVARVEAARAYRSEAAQGFLPFGTAGVDQQHHGISGDRSRTVSAGIEVGWEIDLFGRIRNLNRAADARAEATEAMFAQTQLVVAAEIARTYLELRASEERLAMLERYRADQGEIVDIIRIRVEEGLDDEADLARARTVESEDDLALSRERHGYRLYRSALAVLVGRAPIGFEIPDMPASTPLVYEAIEIGDPSTLLQRRPDVRAAERELAAQTAEIGIATAGLFPQLRLGGVFGFVAGSLGDLGHSEGESWLAGPSLTWDVFNLGRVRSRIHQARAGAQGALASYELAVLRALEDAQNSFSAYAAAQESLVATDQQLQNARMAAEIVELQYDEGMVAYFELLDARRSAVRAEISRIDAIASHRIATVDVLRALGVN